MVLREHPMQTKILVFHLLVSQLVLHTCEPCHRITTLSELKRKVIFPY